MTTMDSQKGKKRRAPAWWDRMLWHGELIKQKRYERCELKLSDHRPVRGIFAINRLFFSCLTSVGMAGDGVGLDGTVFVGVYWLLTQLGRRRRMKSRSRSKGKKQEQLFLKLQLRKQISANNQQFLNSWRRPEVQMPVVLPCAFPRTTEQIYKSC